MVPSIRVSRVRVTLTVMVRVSRVSVMVSVHPKLSVCLVFVSSMQLSYELCFCDKHMMV